jgi:hypothetical protein
VCRNITALRSLDPPATLEEIEDAARQFVRKVAALNTTQQMARADVHDAIDRITNATRELLSTLPPRRVAPAGPPGRWREAARDESQSI